MQDDRFRWLTAKQRAIAEYAKNKGKVSFRYIKVFYSSAEHWERAISKLISFGILKGNKEGYFEYIPSKEEKEKQSKLK